jgi:hypothetical protein
MILSVKRLGKRLYWQFQPECSAYEKPYRDAALRRNGYVLDRVVMKACGGRLLRFGKTLPKLQPMYAVTGLTQCIRTAFRVGNFRTGNHQIDCPVCDDLDVSDAVSVKNFSLKEIGHSGQVDVRVGRHIETLAGLKRMRTHVIEKKPRS